MAPSWLPSGPVRSWVRIGVLGGVLSWWRVHGGVQDGPHGKQDIRLPLDKILVGKQFGELLAKVDTDMIPCRNA